MTVHPVPALHGIGGDQPVVYEFAPGGGPVRFLGYVVETGGIRFYHAGDGLVYPELATALAALAPDVLMLPINGRDHMRESAGIVGNMNETEAAWLCAQVGASYVIPMHYDAIEGNTGDPGHFTTMAHRSGSAAAIVIPDPRPPPHPDPALNLHPNPRPGVQPGPPGGHRPPVRLVLGPEPTRQGRFLVAPHEHRRPRPPG